ncbi:hypothetical protein [Sphingomonas sp. MMS24-J13]|uniref:hypothetical protein n=1 Tax=Sphingomonas sp. MMS24-J13 TaxID=3238686 RepID=UPI0038510E14
MTLDPKHAWQTSGEAHDVPALAEVRAKADKFYRQVRRRNLMEYAACVFVVIACSRNAFVLPHILQKIGSAWIVAAAFYVAWQLHRRGSAVAPEKAVDMPIYIFARTQLVRQRDLLRNIFWGYILPFIPGLALVLIGNGQDPELSRHVPIWQRWMALGFIVAAFTGVWWLNQRVARKLQRRIDEIDALTGEH